MTAEREIQGVVREALTRHLRLKREIGDDDPLLSSGLVDSLGVLEFVSAIEKATGVSIPVTEMTVANLDTVASVAALLRRLAPVRPGTHD